MIAWLIYHRDNSIYNKKYIQFYLEEGAKQGIDFKLLLVEDMEFGVRDGRWFLTHNKIESKKPDFVICRAIYPLLNKQLEYMGIPVFNNSFVAEICNDKARTYQYLASTGIKMIDSSFYQNDRIKKILEEVQSPTVIKAVEGHGGSQVFLLEDSQEALPSTHIEVIEKLASSDVVVQPLTGTRNQDLRVYVIGTEIIAAVLRTAKEGFKSNFSLGGEVGLYPLSEAEIKIVKQIIGQFDFGLVGIDFIIGDEGELIFNEIEDVVGSRMLYQCSDINIVEKYLFYIKGRLMK
ncbi:MAG: hypothetical protein K0R34_1176 [Herbinix sp.]|jgi:gamma-F420-2:alpha-L-glutamate ligase|nr:hypothetical protein [Herbinix sp.]